MEKSVKTLLDLADAPEDVEILLGLDPDDVENYRNLPHTYFVAPERWGYANLHRYYTALGDFAQGEWLFLWNDDALMETQGWDTELLSLPSDVLVADFQSFHSPSLCCFPAVRVEAVDAVGGFSLHTNHCDTYWQDIGHATGTIRALNSYVNHQRYDVSGQNQDTTWHESQAGYRTSEYYGVEIQHLIGLDIETIRGIL